MNIHSVADISKKISRTFGYLLRINSMNYLVLKGVIRSYTINDAFVGRSVEETIRLVKSFQYAEQFVEVCPAIWN